MCRHGVYVRTHSLPFLNDLHAGHWSSLQSNRNRPQHQSAVRDVWDGSALKPLCAPGRFFSNPFNLALSLCTDGVEVFKSSRVCLWPVYLAILNLPARIRMKAENMLLCGLWVGPGKPPISLLLAPIAKTIRSLGTLGLQVRTFGGLCTVHAKLVMGVFDLPAKAAVLCVKQFNGRYGCTVCEHPGTRLNRVHVYPPDMYPERTHATVITAAEAAESTNEPVLGVKGMSSLARSLDLVASIPVDYMHAVLEGVTKRLINSWFNSANHRQPYYLGRSLSQIDKLLLQQRPPQEFSRPPRSIRTHLKFWKASEFRNWLLYYSLPILLNYLPPLFWHHYALLVCAMHILLNDQIANASIDAAEQMLCDFHLLLGELYGTQSYTANAHLLLHVTKYVRLWGPLWTHSAFGFENKNGQLKHLFHGKSDITHQILFNVDVSYTLQLLRPHLTENESDSCTSYIYQPNRRLNMTCIGQKMYIVGQSRLTVPSAEQCYALAVRPDDRVQVFSRLLMDGTMYLSTNYPRALHNKRDDTVCSYYEASSDSICFGRIELFTATPRPSALLRKLHQLEQTLLTKGGHACRPQLTIYQQVDLLNSYIVPVALSSSSSPLVSVPLDGCGLSKAVTVSVSDTVYAIVQPNSVEYH